MHYLFLFLFISKVFISCLVIFSYHSVAMKSSQICRPANLFKTNSATGVFLQTLRIFSEMAFLLKTREWLLLFSVLKSFLNILGLQMCCQLIYPEANSENKIFFHVLFPNPCAFTSPPPPPPLPSPSFTSFFILNMLWVVFIAKPMLVILEQNKTTK